MTHEQEEMEREELKKLLAEDKKVTTHSYYGWQLWIVCG